ncbi:MAG: TonB C-terminal domain-containing protein [Aliarcobacter sp.]|nr:TonB C-terminal domain-containing protein [Aliarcobacter sp.]
MENKFSFILSGIIAFSFYIFICVLIMYYLFSPIPKTLDLKSTSMTIELDMITEKAEKKMVEKKTEKIIEKEAVKEKEASVSNEKKPDLKSLFANVKETAKTVTKEEVNNIEKSIDPKRFKAKLEKEKRSNNIKIDKLLEDEKTATNTKSTNANKGQETDEYFSKVQELLDVWNPVGTGLKAVVLIMIDLDGRFDYRFVTGSGDEGFDSSLKAFLEEQKNLAYPKPTKEKDIKVNVNFRSEG